MGLLGAPTRVYVRSMRCIGVDSCTRRARSTAALIALVATGLGVRTAFARETGQVADRIVYPRPAAILQLTGPQGQSVDPATGRSHSAMVVVETGPHGATLRRFAVHVPDRSLLGLGQRVARFLGILWGLADMKIGTLNAKLKSGTADVWICRDGEAGGEQSRSSIYLYDALASRSDFEWARIVAHEYGHYLLPGPSGYTEPEPWSNGLFGERLFIGWLYDELRTGRLSADDTGLLTLATAEDYYRKQVEPLVDRIAANGPNAERLARKDKAGMDEAIALLLYADRLHGARSIPSMLEWLPPRLGRQPSGRDFLDAYVAWLDHSDAIQHRPLGISPFQSYWPTGTFEASGLDHRPPDVSVQNAQESKSERGTVVTIARSGWRQVRIGPREGAPPITWTRPRPKKP